MKLTFEANFKERQMRKALLFGILSILLTSMSVHADTSRSISSEMLIADKPIDPKCINAAMDSPPEKGVNVAETCPEFWGDGFSADELTLVINPTGAGYDFKWKDDENRSGGFYYEVLGKTSEGIVVNIDWSTGGSGHWSSLGIYKRSGDVLRKVRIVAGGDRAWGGVGAAKVEDGHLLYGYNMTSLELYQKYMPNAPHRSDLGSGFSNVGAIVHMKDDKIEGIELAENAIIPDCFKEKYIKQVTTKKTISEGETKILMQEFSEACPLTEKR